MDMSTKKKSLEHLMGFPETVPTSVGYGAGNAELSLSLSLSLPPPRLVATPNEAVFNSASALYYDASFHVEWIVDKVPDQALLNIAERRFIIPQLYKKYSNDDMNLNIYVIRSSGSVIITGNNLGGSVKLDDLEMSLKWRKIGNLGMYLIQPVMWTLVQTVNSYLGKGFPLPIIHGFTLQNAEIIFSSSKLSVCTDMAYSESDGLGQVRIHIR
ncbi:hypothetical protein GQ457_04G024810 [Hibiscus cannabinus]